MIEWIALGAVVILIAIGLIGNHLRVDKLRKEGKPDTQMAEIDMKAREKLKSIQSLQAKKRSRLYKFIDSILPGGGVKMEEVKQEEPELYVADPKPPKAPPKPRGQWMKLFWQYRKAGGTLGMKEFIAKKKEGSL